MADIDLKTATPDTTINTSAFLFGADSQSATNPSVYAVSTVKAAIIGAGDVSVASGKTLTASNTLTLAGTDGTTMTFPSTSATLARTDAGNTFTGNQVISGGSFGLSGNISVAAWTTSGVRYKNVAATLTDTSSSGTVATAYTDVFGGNTIAASSATTFTDYYTTFISEPTAGTNVTLTRKWALGLSGDLQIASASRIGFSTDLFLSRRAAANLRLGAADAAAPVSQTLSVQSVVAGTTNTAGANLTITGSQGTGTGAGGSIVFQVAPAGSSGTAQNALVNAMTIDSANNITFGTFTNRAITFGSVGFLYGRGSGVFQLANSTDNGFDRLQFGGTTSSFPALKRSTTVLQARLADDSAFATIQGKLRADANAVAETPTATHTITITDAAGTAYKVLCVAA